MSKESFTWEELSFTVSIMHGFEFGLLFINNNDGLEKVCYQIDYKLLDFVGKSSVNQGLRLTFL